MPSPQNVPLIILLAAAAGLSGCKHKAPMMSAPEVGVVTVTAAPVTLTMDLPGRVVAHRTADVRPQVGGVILKRLFAEGSAVAAGQPLYQIDPAPFEAALQSADATVEKDSATLRSASALLQRYGPLMEANAVSKQDYDNALAAQLGAAADLSAARAALQVARLNLAYASVQSPISGQIGRSVVPEGALVTANQATSLATVQQLDPIYVDVTQPSALLLRLRRAQMDGTLESAGKNQAVVRLTLEDGTLYLLPGKLLASEVTVDPGSGSITLRAVFPNPDHLLLPGMFVHEQVPEGVDEEALLVPQQAVTHDQRGEPIAYVVTKDNKAELRTLKTDRAIGDQWLVTDGISDGDRVIVEGLQKVGPGAPVTAVEVSSRTVPTTASAAGSQTSH
jgi:membrane fusion protein, multidrug efflux system